MPAEDHDFWGNHVSAGSIQLLLIALGGVVVLVLLIVSKLKLHPLLALMGVSILVGMAAGMDLGKIADAIEKGAGETLGNVGIVIALGAILGKILSDSGATERLANAILDRSSARALPWAMSGAAFVIGIPMFFEVGLVMLLPLIFSVAKKLEERGGLKGSPYIWVGVPAIAALAAMHGMVPPHPGPLTAIATLRTDVGPTLLYGIVAGVPAIILAGPVYARLIAPKMRVRPDAALLAQYTSAPVGQSAGGLQRNPEKPGPGLAISLLAVLLPALLMLFRTAGEAAFPLDSAAGKITVFLGEPVIAMFVGVVFAVVVLAYGRGAGGAEVRHSMAESLKAVAGILLIIAGGGAFKQVLVDAKVGDAIVDLTQNLALPALVLGWLIAMLLSVSTGSSTVGVVGASGLLAPLALADPSLNLPLLVIAIGSGSLFFAYANHASFWLVKESFGMSMGEATKAFSVTQSIVSLVGLGMALLLNLLPAWGG
ncbi:gluconate:H+ symporter [Arthrobacter russicus]|jgi:GntP family gluconate:H+ symporter